DELGSCARRRLGILKFLFFRGLPRVLQRRLGPGGGTRLGGGLALVLAEHRRLLGLAAARSQEGAHGGTGTFAGGGRGAAGGGEGVREGEVRGHHDPAGQQGGGEEHRPCSAEQGGEGGGQTGPHQVSSRSEG